MRIATWNINNVRKHLQHLLAWLETTQPDAVALQELKCTEADFPRAELEAAGYGCLVVGQKTWNGVALLARRQEPLPILRALPGDKDDTQARYCEAAIDGIVIAGLYLPNGNPWPGPKFDYKLAWFQRLQHRADELRKQKVPVVIAGDFNVVPTDARSDIYATRSYADNALLQPEPRKAYKRLLDSGWTDALDFMKSDHPTYTFWSFMRDRYRRDAGLRIDHLLLSKDLRPRLTATGVDKAVRGLEGGSDHAPAWIELS
ncbi:exodeoxyribonuclease III [soil metagenome]